MLQCELNIVEMIDKTIEQRDKRHCENLKQNVQEEARSDRGN